MPGPTYQFHVLTDTDGKTQHLVKDSEVVDIRWRDTPDVRKIVLVNGNTITVSDSIQSLKDNFTFPQVDVVFNLDADRHYVLNRDHIDQIEWVANANSGTIILSNGTSIAVQMNALIQLILTFQETINPE